jgi:hypothetical protein
MSSKISYPQFKEIYSQFCADMRKRLFEDNFSFHGWTQEEFFEMFDAEYFKTSKQFVEEFQEMNGVEDEETYDLFLSAPLDLQ